jgi:hypothetical protein
VFNGAFAIRVLDFVLLIGVLIIAVRLAYRSLSSRPLPGSVPVSRVLVGGYGIFLMLASFFCITQLFVTK